MSPRPLSVPAFPRENVSPSSSADASEFQFQGARPPLQGSQHIYTPSPVNVLKRPAESAEPAVRTLPAESRDSTTTPGKRYPSPYSPASAAPYPSHAHPSAAAFHRNQQPPTPNSLPSHRQTEYRRSSQRMDHHGRTLSSPPLSQVDAQSAETSPDRR